jgi:hypothetical protein
MKKKNEQDLARIAMIMYRMQESCKHKYWCDGCPAYTGKVCKLKAGKAGVPAGWNITKETIERMECGDV